MISIKTLNKNKYEQKCFNDPILIIHSSIEKITA